MSRHLPGLSALRTFEAAARHLGFTRAAGELGVTPAAVSNQIRVLEGQLGVRLFSRTSRAVRLTKAGEALLAGVTGALDLIGQTIERVSAPDGQRTLTVTATPSFAAKWLVPRLDRFRQQQPDADVRIDVSERLVDFSREDADIGIRFGNGIYPGLRVDCLFDEFVFPVCSPRLLKRAHPLHHPSDLRHHTLIHVGWQAQRDTWPDWRLWLLAAGVNGIDSTRGIHFSQTALAIQAAIDGQGIALGNTSLVGDDLAARRLVRPFELSLKGPSSFAYYLVSPKPTSDQPLVKAFREWVLREVHETDKKRRNGRGAALGKA